MMSVEFIADQVAPHVSWPSDLHCIADELEKVNPRFNRHKFIIRATKAWEKRNLEHENINDSIPY